MGITTSDYKSKSKFRKTCRSMEQYPRKTQGKHIRSILKMNFCHQGLTKTEERAM